MSQLTLDLPASLMERLTRLAAHEKRSVEELVVDRLSHVDMLPSGCPEDGFEELQAGRVAGRATEMDRETELWLGADLGGELPPYDWGELDPLTLGHPVRYVPGVGLIVEQEQMPDAYES